MNRFRSVYRCAACGNKWRGPIHSNADDAAFEEPPECPTCLKVLSARGFDFNSNRAPAIIGGNVAIKAIDETQKIVTEDYGLTDIRTDVRDGETAAPKLAPRLQAAADNMFAPQRRQAARANPNLRPAKVISMASRMRDPRAPDAMRLIHDAKQRPPVHFVNER